MSARRVIHTVSSLQVGGAERLVLDLASVQQGQGLTPVILSFGSDQDPLCEVARRRGIALVSLKGATSRYAKVTAIHRALSGEQPSALHIHSPWCLRPLAPMLPFFKGKVIYTRHGAHAYDTLGWRL